MPDTLPPPAVRRHPGRMIRDFVSAGADARAVAMFLLLIGFLVAINALNVVNSYVGRDFMSAIEHRDRGGFVAYAWIYVGVFALSTVAAVLYRFLEERLGLHWRESQTRRVLHRYLEQRRYLHLEEAALLPNADQRIAEDIRSFTVTTLSFVLLMLNASFTILAFSGVLWSISPRLFGVAVAYALAGSLLTALLGRRLVGLNVAQLDREADLRAELIQLREHAEAVAVMQHEERAHRRLLLRLQALVQNSRRMIAVNRNLGFFTNGYNYLIQIIPALLVAPLFIRGEAEFGVIAQSGIAFTHLMGAFSLAVTQFQSISSYAAVVERLSDLMDALDEGDRPASPVVLIEREGPLVYEALNLCRPDGSPLLRDLNLSIEAGERVAILGAPDARLALFRATAGLHAQGAGRILRPAHGRLMLVPERPYLPRSSLRELLDGEALAHDEAQLREVLAQLDLERLARDVGGLDAPHDWAGVSAAQQSALALARVLLARPALALLDRIDTVLGEAATQRALRLLRARGIGYAASLDGEPPAAAFDRRLLLAADGSWTLG